MDVKKQKIDKYTRKTRRQREGGVPIPFFLHKVRNGIEGVNRRFWYGLLRIMLRNEPLRTKIPIGQLKSLLIIPYGSAIGDLIVSLAVARVVKSRNPDCKIGIITSHRNDSILRCDPDFHAQYQFTGRSDKENYKNLRRARKENYQVVLNLHFQRMSDYGLISNYISPRGIKVSIQHKRGEMYRILFNHLCNAARFKVHVSQLALRMLDDVIDFGDQPIKANESRPSVHICQEVFDNTRARINTLLASSEALWFIYANPQARNPFREWGLENNLSFADRILEKYPQAMVLMTSAPIEQPALVESIAKHGNSRIAFFETSYDLNEIATLCRLARMIVTPDTSVVHLASAENKPCIVFYPEHHITPREWLPLQVPSFQFGVSAVDRPVSEIPVADVVRAAEELLEGRFTSTATNAGLTPQTPAAYQASNGDEDLIALIAPEVDHIEN